MLPAAACSCVFVNVEITVLHIILIFGRSVTQVQVHRITSTHPPFNFNSYLAVKWQQFHTCQVLSCCPALANKLLQHIDMHAYQGCSSLERVPTAANHMQIHTC